MFIRCCDVCQKRLGVNKHILKKQAVFHRVFELARLKTTTEQKRRNASNNKKFHGPTYKDGDFILFRHAVTATGQSPKVFSPWRGFHRILKRIDDVNYKIKELSTQKHLIVQNDRMKPFHGQPRFATSLPERQPDKS